MTQVKSRLKLNKMVIFQDDHEAYNENFHEGTNIIYGDNGAGKSTILNMIFYALGGDLKDWTDQMLACSVVVVELSLNGQLITAKREIENRSRKPMSIYYGSYDEAMKKNIDGWKKFSYNMSTNKKSFSQEFFDLLDFPEMRSDFESNITMHQLLRLMYVDQKSSADSLFIQEDFDSPLLRRGIGEFLLGFYDDELYDLELKHRNLESQLKRIKQDIKSTREILREAELSDNPEMINEIIESKRQELTNVRTQIKKLENTSSTEEDDPTQNIAVEQLKEQILPVKQNLRKKLEMKEQLEYDISDSELFIENLELKIESLSQSETTKRELDTLNFEFCPKCLTPLEDNDNGHHCSLCKEETNSDKAQYTRIRQQIKHQIEESEMLLSERKDTLQELKNDIPNLREKYLTLQNRLNESTSSVKSSRNEKLDNLYIDQGYLESSIESLSKQLKLVKVLSRLETEEQETASEIEKIETRISQKNRKISKNKRQAQKSISDNVSYLVSKDLQRQKDFLNPQSVGVHFYKNTFSLNGHNQFSASSMTLLKKSISLAILFSSKINDFFRFPRFLMIDNIEDKGMEPKRNRNFQEIFVKRNEEIPGSNQLIFSTSDLSSNIDPEQYCVGKYYTIDNKSLDLKNSLLGQ